MPLALSSRFRTRLFLIVYLLLLSSAAKYYDCFSCRFEVPYYLRVSPVSFLLHVLGRGLLSVVQCACQQHESYLLPVSLHALSCGMVQCVRAFVCSVLGTLHLLSTGPWNGMSVTFFSLCVFI